MTVRALRTVGLPLKSLCVVRRALISADIVHKENIPDVIKDIAAINKKNENHVMTRFLCQRGIQGSKRNCPQFILTFLEFQCLQELILLTKLFPPQI